MPVSGGKKAGKIIKPYGLQGQVHMILEPEAGKLIEIGNPLFIEIDGQRVPFFVEEYEQVSADQAILKLEFISSIEEAREVNGCEVHFSMSQNTRALKGKGDFKTLVGYHAFDQELGFLGTISDHVMNEFNSVFIVDYKGKELMIPAVDELIADLNHTERILLFHLPEGLTTL